MYKIIGADGKEYGPISETQVRQWIAEGRANGQTVAQAEGTTEWKPLKLIPEFAELVAALPIAPFPSGEAPPPLASGPGLSVDDILARDYSISVGSCISRGWALVKANMGILVGGTALALVVMMGLGMIPYIGGCIGLFINGPIMAGIYWLHLKAIRGQNPEIGDGFAGFQRGYLHLILVNIVTSLFVVLVMIPGIVMVVVGVIAGGFFSISRGSGATAGMIVLAAVGVLVALIPAIYLSVCWFFSLALVIDRQMEFWGAMKLSMTMVRKHWGSVFGLAFVSCLIGVLGILVCCVGLFFTYPIMFASLTYGYEEIFGSRST